MLNINQATEIVRKAIPNGEIQTHIVYNDLYLFQVFTDNPGEGEWDPFYSVNSETGEFSDFSILDDDITEITDLFMEAKQKS